MNSGSVKHVKNKEDGVCYSVLCMSAMLLDTKYSMCASNKYKINETQSYLL